MPGFNTLPATGGGGGQANMTYVASIHMTTYNRSWAQGGTAGYYAVYSTNQENGYAYFVGSATTTGIALNRLAQISHDFTRIDIIAPQNDMVSLYKAKVKATTEFANAFANFPSFPTVIGSSGNFVLPNNALPLVNVLVVGAGGPSGWDSNTSHGGSGGGGGGGVVKLTAYQAVGTTGVSIGHAPGPGEGNFGGRTYFGNVYALGGGWGNNHNNEARSAGGAPNGATGGGGGGYYGQTRPAAVGAVQTASTGLGNSGAPLYYGGTTGGRNIHNGSNGHHRGGGGAGSAGNGQDGGNNADGNGGIGHVSDIEGTNHTYGPGGRGSSAHGSHGTDGWSLQGLSTRGHGGPANQGGGSGGGSGAVVVRYYIP